MIRKLNKEEEITLTMENANYSEEGLLKLKQWVDEELKKKKVERDAASLALNRLYLNKYFYVEKQKTSLNEVIEEFYIYVTSVTPRQLRVLAIPVDPEVAKDEYGIWTAEGWSFEDLFVDNPYHKEIIENFKSISKETFMEGVKKYINKIIEEE